MGKLNVAYSDVFENLEAVINTSDENQPILSRVYNTSQSAVNKFKLNQVSVDDSDDEYNEFIKNTEIEMKQKQQEAKKEQERIEKERREKELQEKLEKEQLEKEQLEKERLERERIERERQAQEQERREQEKERLELQKREQERLEQERQKQEQEKLERERQKQEQERSIDEEKRLAAQRKEDHLEKIKQSKQSNSINFEKVKPAPIKTNGTQPIIEALSKKIDTHAVNSYNRQNHKKLIISNVEGETLYEDEIKSYIKFNEIDLPLAYQNDQINEIKIETVNNDEVINVIIDKKNIDLKKIIYRKIIPVDNEGHQLSEPIVQSVVFRGKLDVENNTSQWFSQDLKFDVCRQLPDIPGMVSNTNEIQPLTINVHAYEDNYEIKQEVTYDDMYEVIDKDFDQEIIYISAIDNQEIERLQHSLIKYPYVRNLKTNKVNPIKLTSLDQDKILNQLKDNSQHDVIDYSIEGNRVFAYVGHINQKPIETKPIDQLKNQTLNVNQLDQPNKTEVRDRNDAGQKSKYKPVKQNIKDAFMKVNIPKPYQYNKYNEFEPIKDNINDMKYYQIMNNRYTDRFLEHVNVVRKELKLKKMKSMNIDMNEQYQMIESLLKTNQNIVNNRNNNDDTQIIDFCKEYMKDGNCVFDFIALQKKASVNSKLTPEYLADRDFQKIIDRLNSYNEHRQLSQDKEINHLIRNKSQMLNSLFIKNISEDVSSNDRKKYIYEYSTIKIYS